MARTSSPHSSRADGLRLAVTAAGAGPAARDRPQRRVLRRRLGRGSGRGIRRWSTTCATAAPPTRWPTGAARARCAATTWTTSRRCAAAGRATASTWSPIRMSGSWRALRGARTRSACGRLVLLSPAPPDPAAAPAAAARRDHATRVFARLAALQQAPPPATPRPGAEAFWAVLQRLYVADPALAPRVADWGRCDAAQRARLPGLLDGACRAVASASAAPADADLARVTCPVLVVHGTADRSAPYAGGTGLGRDGCRNARLLTLDGVAHAPWIELRDEVIEAVATFLDGAWPPAAKVGRQPRGAESSSRGFASRISE